MIDRDVTDFIERSGVRFRHGLAIALIVDANREQDVDQAVKNLAEARGLLDVTELAEVVPAHGAPVAGRSNGKRAVTTEIVVQKQAKQRGRPPKFVAKMDREKDDESRRVSKGAHHHRCKTCGEMKHATAFFDGQRETCTKCKNKAAEDS